MPPARPGAPLVWAAYLASSWTWCIGMFLPVLLIRDFGWWGFVAFAVPNVLGAAAMGWVLARPCASESLERRHGGAMRCFSLVTILFQLFFALLVVGAADSLLHAPIIAIATFLLAAIGAATLRPPALPACATVASIALAVAFLALSQSPLETALAEGARPELPRRDILFLAPVCMFGFLLCPYLDLTFHRARQALPTRSSRTAFGLGFGGFFLVMILFTALYSPVFLSPVTRLAPAAVVLAHILLQLGITTGLHTRELAAPAWRRSGRGRITVIGAAAIVLTIWALLMPALGGGRTEPELVPRSGGAEETYRSFMAFYGLVFPAYVYLCMRGAGLTRSGVRSWAFAVGLAAPMFWMGFLERATWWLGPGLAVVLLARLVARSTRAGNAARSVPTVLSVSETSRGM